MPVRESLNSLFLTSALPRDNAIRKKMKINKAILFIPYLQHLRSFRNGSFLAFGNSLEDRGKE
jgi:hypothetical protein